MFKFIHAQATTDHFDSKQVKTATHIKSNKVRNAGPMCCPIFGIRLVGNEIFLNRNGSNFLIDIFTDKLVSQNTLTKRMFLQVEEIHSHQQLCAPAPPRTAFQLNFFPLLPLRTIHPTLNQIYKLDRVFQKKNLLLRLHTRSQ
jgi:hypothetical protein